MQKQKHTATSCAARSGAATICPAPCKTGDLNSHPQLSAFLRSPRMSVMWVIVLHIPGLKFIDLPVLKKWLIFSHCVKQPCNLKSLTFNLSNSKQVTGHGSPVSSCQFSACSALPFSTYGQARDRQMDRQTDDGHQTLHTPNPL